MSKHGHHHAAAGTGNATSKILEVLTGIVHVYVSDGGAVMSLSRHARISVLSRDAQKHTLALRCEIGPDYDFHDPAAVETLPEIALPQSIYDEHDKVLIFRIVQDAPVHREYTFKVGKNGHRLSLPNQRSEQVKELACALNDELNAVSGADE